MKVNVIEYNSHNGLIRWQISIYKSHTREFFASSHRFRGILHLKIRDLENVSQGHDVKHSQWRHSMANN